MAAGVTQTVEIPRIDAWRDTGTFRCRTCMWWVMKGWGSTMLLEGEAEVPRQAQGRCRRHAPTLGGYPAVFWDDWCGDHKLKAGA